MRVAYLKRRIAGEVALVVKCSTGVLSCIMCQRASAEWSDLYSQGLIKLDTLGSLERSYHNQRQNWVSI